MRITNRNAVELATPPMAPLTAPPPPTAPPRYPHGYSAAPNKLLPVFVVPALAAALLATFILRTAQVQPMPATIAQEFAPPIPPPRFVQAGTQPARREARILPHLAPAAPAAAPAKIVAQLVTTTNKPEDLVGRLALPSDGERFLIAERSPTGWPGPNRVAPMEWSKAQPLYELARSLVANHIARDIGPDAAQRWRLPSREWLLAQGLVQEHGSEPAVLVNVNPRAVRTMYNQWLGQERLPILAQWYAGGVLALGAAALLLRVGTGVRVARA